MTRVLSFILAGSLWWVTACGPIALAQSQPPSEYPATTFGFSQDGNFKAGLWWQTVYVFDLRSGSVSALPPMPDDISPGTLVVFSADNQLLAAQGCSDGTGTFCRINRIVVWDITERKLIRVFATNEIITVGKMNFTTDNQQLVAEGCVFIETLCDTLGHVTFDLQVQEPARFATLMPEVTPTFFPLSPGEYSVTAISPDSHLKAAMSINSSPLYLWNLTNQEVKIEPISLRLEYDSINQMIFSPDSRLLAHNGCVASQSLAKWRTCVESRVLIWDMTTRAVRHVLDADPLLNVNELSFSDDSATLEATGCLVYESKYAEVCADGQIGSQRWNVITGAVIPA